MRGSNQVFATYIAALIIGLSLSFYLINVITYDHLEAAQVVKGGFLEYLVAFFAIFLQLLAFSKRTPFVLLALNVLWTSVLLLGTLLSYDSSYMIKHLIQVCLVLNVVLTGLSLGTNCTETAFVKLQKAIDFLVFSTIVISIPNFLFYLKGTDLPWFIFRPYGQYFGANVFIVLWLVFSRTMNQYLRILSICLFVIVIFLTGTRSHVYFVSLVLVGWLTTMSKRTIVVLIIVVLCIVLVGSYLFEKIEKSEAEYRYSIFARYLSLFETGRYSIWDYYFSTFSNSSTKNLLLGFGDRGLLASEAGASFFLAHNTPLHLLVLSGFLGFTVGFALLIYLGISIIRIHKHLGWFIIVALLGVSLVIDLPLFYNGFSRIIDNFLFSFSMGFLLSFKYYKD